MIKVTFECEKCGCTKGEIVTWDRTTEVQCKNCGTWETMKDETDINLKFKSM